MVLGYGQDSGDNPDIFSHTPVGDKGLCGAQASHPVSSGNKLNLNDISYSLRSLYSYKPSGDFSLGYME